METTEKKKLKKEKHYGAQFRQRYMKEVIKKAKYTSLLLLIF